MKYGITLRAMVPGLSTFVQLARETEDTGFGGVYIPEAVNDALMCSLAVANATKRIDIATWIVNIYLREPSLCAIAAEMVQEAAQGRFILGLGVSHRPAHEARGIDRFAHALRRAHVQHQAIRHLGRELRGLERERRKVDRDRMRRFGKLRAEHRELAIEGLTNDVGVVAQAIARIAHLDAARFVRRPMTDAQPQNEAPLRRLLHHFGCYRAQ